MPDQQILQTIQPVVFRVYGKAGMPQALAEHLAEKIGTWEPGGRHETREDMILHTCWNWFAGGGTAEIAAREIEAALNDD